MSKKIRQGQSRWIVWAYQDVKRDTNGALLNDYTRQRALSAPEEAEGSKKTYCLERVEVVSVIHGGRSVVVKMGDLGNTSTWPAEDFRKCPDTFRKAQRVMAEAQARA